MPAKKIFISYSTEDAEFAEKLQQRLEEHGYDVFRDVGETIAGPLDQQLKDRIYESDALLLIFSEASIQSPWVEWEVQIALDRERTEGIHILCPIRLDEAWLEASWRGPILHQVRDYTILDFSHPESFEGIFKRLRKGLDLYYGAKPIDS